MDVPALVVGHALDPMRPLADAEMLAGELTRATFLTARTPLEWRLHPKRLDQAAIDLAHQCWRTPRRGRRTGS